MPSLRVISGTAKGRRLISVPGDSTRPITDRVKEAFFNILGNDIVGATFWDVFAGTGSVGIEALSRGASFCRFTENNRQAIQTINQNVKVTGFSEKSEVTRCDALKLLSKIPDYDYEYIYIAPPQYKQLWEEAICLLDKNLGWLAETGWITIQIHPVEYKRIDQIPGITNLIEFDSRKYGSTMLLFCERKIE
jgi:16S rRNA (guanine966-N2)-methyltransferase